MKKTIAKIFTLFFASTLLYGAYGNFSGVIAWVPWYFGGAKVIEKKGTLESIKWSGGKSSCGCWVIKASTLNGIIYFDSYKSGYGGSVPAISNEYLFKYQLSPRGRSRVVGIFNPSENLNVYQNKLYDGFGIAVSAIIFGGLFLTLSVLMFMLGFGRFDKHVSFSG